MTALQVIAVAVISLTLAGCGGFDFWDSSGGLFITAVEVEPDPIPAGSLARISWQTKDTRTGGVDSYAEPISVTVSAGMLFETQEQAAHGASLVDGGGTHYWGNLDELWWVAPDSAQQATVQVEYASDEQTITVEITDAP